MFDLIKNFVILLVFLYVVIFVIKPFGAAKLNEKAQSTAQEKTVSETFPSSLGSENYYNDLTEVAIWKNPKKITVCIDQYAPKKHIFKKAFEAWDRALYDMVNFEYIDNIQKADIYAREVNISEYKGADTIGNTPVEWYQIGSKRYIDRAEVTVSYNDTQGRTRSDSEFYAIALHEIGHALGIISHSPTRGDVMYQDTSSYEAIQNARITKRDINTLRYIYGKL